VGRDVIVVGLGGMGSAVAHQLAARGLRVLGLERFGPAHDRGSSHGGSRIFRTAYFEHLDYVPLLQRAEQGWRALEYDAGVELLVATGCLIVGPVDGEAIVGSITSADRFDIPHELLDATDLRRRYSPLTPTPDEVGVLELGAGYVRPEAAVRALLGEAGRRGADLRFDLAVTSWSTSGTGVQVETVDGDRFEADHLVLCPGAWAPQLLGGAVGPLQVQRRVQYWIEPLGSVAPFQPAVLPVYAWDLGLDGLFYGFPDIDGDGRIKVAIHRGIDVPCDPDTIERTVGAEEVAHMRGLLAERIPALDAAPVAAATCMYTDTPDEHFVLGPHPDYPQVTVAAGFSGHGFKFVPVIGELVAEWVTGTSAHLPAIFAPDRHTAPG
jgi:sarcosine oxidase